MQNKWFLVIGTVIVAIPLLAINVSCNKGNSNSPTATGDTAGSSATATDAGVDGSTADAATSSAGTSDSSSAMPLVERPAKQDIVPTPSGISLEPVDAEAYRAVVAKHQGKVVLVDCWATWCGPCTEQFPHTVELARTHADKGLAVVSVSFDEPDQPKSALDFLEKQGAKFDNLIAKSGASLESFVSFEIEGGALPFYKLYDRQGKLRYQFCGDPTGLENVLKIEEIDPKVEELLAEKS